MKAAVFESFGEPSEVLRIRDVPTPEPGPGEVRVRMIASPINPSDLMVVEGRYGVLPTLPSTPGFEGVGVVDKAGPGLMGRLVVGKRVAVINSKGGNWAEYAVIPWRQARPIAADIPDDQAATFFVNPATALAMVRHVLKVPKGEWLLISAAGSTLGKMIIKLGKHDGFKTLCVVRRSEAKAELVALGADAVISSSEGPVPEQVRAITGGDGPRYALDPVGGEAGTAIFRSLGTGGRLIVYGSLTGQSIEVDPRLVISGRRVVEGFWLGFWMRDRSIPASLLLFREIAALIRNDVLTSEIGASYALDDVVPAVREAAAVGRGGKVLLKLPGSSS
ncbi:MAG: zinc-dependent alcohol dehydrogenase family protein [Paludisphaera borealis]|uniref:zinc-dependent alcohol dehydrogenase family protein n=1 Tax=Paludisphaera borealis TaxID=1387353 RepID=UPI0028484951|nr:zinc-dependent alcohol dehydrogenase family protein [Paludisphaera borealis]MDR3618876.1 zinc-dependent alcohol dehydrogenase family protein [Paludisphaera borealis]